MMRHLPPFAELYPSFIGTGAPSTSPELEVLLVRLCFSRSRAVSVLASTFVVALLIGVVVGITTHCVETGLGIFASVLGLVTGAQGYLLIC